jgi:lipopolysaccharide/colanic/teichoic acid biosynthesis glycosyltransferase
MAKKSNFINPFWFVVPDFFVMLASLYLTLLIRHGQAPTADELSIHFGFFLPLFFVWLAVMFGHNLFDEKIFKRHHVLFFSLLSSAFFCFIAGVVYFYLQPQLLITPRRTLLLLVAVTYILFFAFYQAAKFFLRNRAIESFYIVEDSNELDWLALDIAKHDYLGLRITGSVAAKDLGTVLLAGESSLIVSNKVLADTGVIKKIYELRESGLLIYPEGQFIELLYRRVPLEQIHENWLILNIDSRGGRVMDGVRRIIDFVLGLAVGSVFIVTFPLVITLIKLDSPGPVFFVQPRVGQNNKIIKVIKYRTMRDGGQITGWTLENDPRITKVGKFLRLTKIDELPQFVNLIKGDMSLVGPRPEQVGIVEELKVMIPFYNERHLVKPGLTGWAQLNIYASSLEDSKRKLEYDLYYLKHRSIMFDLEIIIKTLYGMITNKGR